MKMNALVGRIEPGRGSRSAACAMLAMTLAAGCGGGRGVAPGPSADPVEMGWSRFEAGDYDEARVLFRDAVAFDGTDADALDGLGWSLARLDSLDTAVTTFETCLALSPPSPLDDEARAGLAASARDTRPPEYQRAIASADSVLAHSPDFAFRHNDDVDWQDLRLIIAQSACGLGSYDRALSEVVLLGGVPPDPGDPGFVSQLVDELARLEELLDGR